MKQFSNVTKKLTDEYVVSVYSNENKYDVMLDGIINEEEYKKAARKVLWIMKEPHGALPKHISSGIHERIIGIKKDSPLTWKRIALTSYRILRCSENLTHLPSWDIYGKSLNEIAVINLKKTSGKSTTNMTGLKKFFNNKSDDKNEDVLKYADIILQQLNQIQPDIVIGAKTLDILKPYLPNTKNLDFGHFTCNNTIFINTYHPGQRKSSALAYANHIGSRIKQFGF